MNFADPAADPAPAQTSKPVASDPNATPTRPITYVPGLAVCAAIAAAALACRMIPGGTAISPMVIAFALGIAVSALAGVPRSAKTGVRFTAKSLLRIGVAFLGLQLTIHQLAQLGIRTLVIVVAVLITTFICSRWFGRRILGIDPALAELIAAGTSICGASAIIATNAVTGAKDQDVGYAVACVSLFGTVSMIVYPLLFGVLHLDIHNYGLWAGSSVHEVAQVVAAAFQVDPAAVQIAVPVKLARVAMLAPLVLTLGALRFRRQHEAAAQRFQLRQIFPLFMLGFVALVAFNSVIDIPTVWRGWIVQATTFVLTMSLAAIGLETSLRDLRHKGLRPMIFTILATLFIAGLSLTLIEAFV
ncbi:MAG TPA: YeiH family protein [Stellaceae bacterium]|nr:YeiH family protein [Stellaceae bacterium]